MNAITGNRPRSLFRPEVQHARSLAWLGSPRLPGSLSGSFVAIGAFFVTAALIAFLTFGQYTRRVRVQGVVLPTEGITRVVSPSVGWIRVMPVQEGAHVRQGDILYTLSLDTTTINGSTQQAVIDLLKQRGAELRTDLERRIAVDAIKKQSLEGQRRNLVDEMAQADAQIDLATENRDTYRKWVDQQQANFNRSIGTLPQLEQRQETYMSQAGQLEALKRERIQIAAKLSDVQFQLMTFDQQAVLDRGQIQQQIADIERQISEDEAKREITVTAPRDGRITGVISKAGQTVSAGTPLLTILPDAAPPEAQLLVPSSAIGFVRAGGRVLLRYEAFPYQRFGQFPGTITMISRATLKSDEIAQFVTSGGDELKTKSFYRITVHPDQGHVLAYGREEALQVGMQLEAHILTDTRPLYQVVLDPLYSLHGRLSGDTAAAR